MMCLCPYSRQARKKRALENILCSRLTSEVEMKSRKRTLTVKINTKTSFSQWLKNHFCFFNGRKGLPDLILGKGFQHRDLLDLSEETHLWPLGFDCAAWGFICVYAKGFVWLQADVSSPSQFLWLFLACFCTHLLTCLFCSLTASLTQL